MTEMETSSREVEMLRVLGALDSDLEPLRACTANAFCAMNAQVLPLADEPHVETWREWQREGERDGVFTALSCHLPQLAFPIESGMGQTDDYRAATLRGVPVSGLERATGLRLAEPEGLRLVLRPTAGGTVPVLLPRGRADFESLVRALSGRNEPVPLLASMGACTVKGYNDWERLRAYQCGWMAEHPGESWGEEMQRLQQRREVYQDRFLILSDGDYSGVPACEAGFEATAWRERSVDIRLRHECTHYVTLRLFGNARNNPHDELVCDFIGFCGGIGRFDAALFLRGMGLEALPDFREGGRLQHYAPALSPSAFAVLCALVARAAVNLERFDLERPRLDNGMLDEVAVVATLCGVSLTEMVAEDGMARLLEAHASACEAVRGANLSPP